MNDITPWAICFGVFLIYPAVAFVIGFYIGRHGMPLELRIKPGWGKKRESLATDGYGVATDTR